MSTIVYCVMYVLAGLTLYEIMAVSHALKKEEGRPGGVAEMVLAAIAWPLVLFPLVVWFILVLALTYLNRLAYRLAGWLTERGIGV
jgi:hypothetical protein